MGYLNTGVHRLCMDGLGYSRTVLITLVHGILRHRGAYNIWTVLDIPGLSQLLWCTGYLDTGVHILLCMDGLGYSRTVPVTLVHGILRHRCAYIIWTILDIPGLSQLLWCTGYSDTGVHTLYGRSWIFQDCPSYFGARDTQTQVCIHYMDGLVYSRTVSVTLVYGILRHRGAYIIMYGRSWIFQDCPSYFGARDTQTQVCIHYMDDLGYSRTVPVTLVHGILRHRGTYIIWTVLDIPGLSQLLWCTGYSDTGVHTLYGRSCIFQDCPSYFGARDTQTQGYIHYMDGLGYSRTVPVTLVHGILRHRCAYIIWTVLDIPGLSQLLWCTGYSDTGVHTLYGRSWIFQDCLSYFGVRDT